MTVSSIPFTVEAVRHPKVLVRLFSKVKVTDTGCWEFTGNRIADGYGGLHLSIGGTRHTARAHRVAYIVFQGPIPDGMDLDHLCSNRLCVNPEHLEAVPHRTNVLRGRRGGSGESGYIGVRRMRSKWQARIRLSDRDIYLGCHDTPEDAARAFDQAAREHLGPDADTNESLGLLPAEAKS